MNDKDIVLLFLNRDETAVTITAQKYEKYLTKIAFNILSDKEDCKESVNDTYLAAWNSIPPNKPENLSTYLGKLTRRISIDLFRKKHRSKRVSSEYTISLDELEGVVSSSDSVEQTIETEHLGRLLNDFLSKLPMKSRNVFIGRYYFLDPIGEVAKYCGITEANAKTILFRTRNMLKEYLKREGYDL